MNIEEMISNYEEQGLNNVDAIAKTCQDIILYKIAKSGFAKNTTIKGGVVMMNLAKDNRRATQDLDLDFIKYSLEETAIRLFIDKLNKTDDNIKLKIVGNIKTLKQKDYEGKRVNLIFKDETKNEYRFKLDIGVHKNAGLEQEELCFELNSSFESITLLVNSKEQIIAEKLKSLLRLGRISTRFKDIFDIYYLIEVKGIDKEKLKDLINDYILQDEEMRENTIIDIYNRLSFIFLNNIYIEKLNSSEGNWLEIPVNEVLQSLLEFFKNLEKTKIRFNINKKP